MDAELRGELAHDVEHVHVVPVLDSAARDAKDHEANDKAPSAQVHPGFSRTLRFGVANRGASQPATHGARYAGASHGSAMYSASRVTLPLRRSRIAATKCGSSPSKRRTSSATQ